MGTLINRGAGWTASDIAADTGSVYVTNVGSSSNSLAKYSLDFANAQGRLWRYEIAVTTNAVDDSGDVFGGTLSGTWNFDPPADTARPGDSNGRSDLRSELSDLLQAACSSNRILNCSEIARISRRYWPNWARNKCCLLIRRKYRIRRREETTSSALLSLELGDDFDARSITDITHLSWPCGATLARRRPTLVRAGVPWHVVLRRAGLCRRDW